MPALDKADPRSFEAVDGTWYFDLQFYRDIGLNLQPLEDASHTAAMPRLRRSAELVVRAASEHPSSPLHQRAKILLDGAHRTVQTLIKEANSSVRYEDLQVEHPAIIAWQSRVEGPKARYRNTPPIERADWIHVGLVSAQLEESPSGEIEPIPKYAPIALPNANFNRNLADVASQLALARVGVWFDI